MARRVEKGEEKEAGLAEGMEWKLWEALNCIGLCCCPAKPQVFLGNECTIPMDSPKGNGNPHPLHLPQHSFQLPFMFLLSATTGHLEGLQTTQCLSNQSIGISAFSLPSSDEQL